LANTRRESTKSADSFEIKVFSGLNTATSFCCKLDHQVRAHRSHRWGRWFESNCHHQAKVVENQRLPSFLPSPGCEIIPGGSFGPGNEAMPPSVGSVAGK